MPRNFGTSAFELAVYSQHTVIQPVWLYTVVIALALLTLALMVGLFLFHRLTRHLQHQIRERDHMDTFLRQAQTETLKVNHELQEVLQEAHALTQAATAANQAKSEFLANMSHEIRTPLNGVLGMLALLQESELSAEQRHYAEVAHISADILLTVIGDILDFARIEARKIAMEQIAVPLRSLVEEVILIVAMRAREKRLEIVYYLDPTAPAAIEGDPARMRQILLNLLGNAIKFTEKGQVRLEVRWDAKATATPLSFHIYDTGIGIPNAQRKILFEPFQQLDSSITRKYGGTGLGLAICRQLVDMMGGQIGSNEEAGGGSHFWFKLPCVTRETHEPAPTLNGTTFYLALKHPLTQQTVNDLLLQWGAEVMAAEDLSQLEDLFATRAPTAPCTLIWETGFAQQTGLETLTTWLKRFPQLSGLVLLPLGDQNLMAQAQLQGLSFLQQPLRAQELSDILQNTPAVLGTPCIESLTHQILLVEDNPINQVVSEAILNKLGYQVDCVTHGGEALKALNAKTYDLVFMDLQMPVMDGFEAIQHIRQGIWKNLPVIAMTAHALEGDAQRCLEAGFSDYLPKPYEMKDLEKRLAHWIPSRR